VILEFLEHPVHNLRYLGGCSVARIGANLFIILSFFIFTPTLGSASSPHMNLDHYIRKNLLVNEQILQAEIQRKISEEKNQRASDVFQNSLTLQPGLYIRDFKSDSGQAFHEERSSLFGSMTQRLPTGSLLGLESTYFLNEVNPTVGGGMNSDYRFYIEQPLWRNSFGSLWRRQQESAEAEIRQMDLNLQTIIVDACILSAENFINAYVSQQEFRLMDQAFAVAEKAKRIAENGFKQSFLRKIDYLNSQSDYLKVKNDRLRVQAELEQRLNTLKVQAEDEKLTSELANPGDFFENLALISELPKEQILKLQSLTAQIEAQKLQYYAEKNRARSAIDLGAETRRTQSLQASNTGLLNAQQEVTQVYLRLQLPLINKTLRADVATAHHNWIMSEFEKQKQEKLIMDQFFQNLTQFKNRQNQLQIATENIKIKQTQLQEANKLLRIGRIEFNDYVIYRDSLLNEELGLLRIQSALWQLKAKLAQYDTTFLKKCKDTLL
jgi:outer membrane protein TolC